MVKGQDIARGWLSQSREVYEAILGSIHPATLNVWVSGVFGSWPHRLRPSQFDASTKRVDCTVNGVEGFILWVEGAQSYGDGDYGQIYEDKSMFEIVCRVVIPDVPPGTTVLLETDLSAI